MSNGKYIIGRGTVLKVASLLDCDRVKPDDLIFEVGTAGTTAGATSVPITITGTVTKNIPASVNYPLFLNFVEPNGKDHFVEVTAPITPTSTTLTVKATKKAITAGAVAAFPVILRNRNNANLTANDNQVDVMTFENQGWRDQVTTMLGQGLEANGYYSPLDAGWNTCLQARLGFAEIYWELNLPKPGCDSDTTWTKGHVIWGYGGVSMPIEVAADQVINSNISITSRGVVTFVSPT